MNRKEQYFKAFKLFKNNKCANEVALILNISTRRAKKWKAAYNKNAKANLEQKFIVDFGCGRISISQLAKKYNVENRNLLKLKHKHFGKGSLKQKRMYQMYLAEIPTRAIASFYNVPIQQVCKAIRNERKKGLLA